MLEYLKHIHIVSFLCLFLIPKCSKYQYQQELNDNQEETNDGSNIDPYNDQSPMKNFWNFLVYLMAERMSFRDFKT